MFDKNYMKTVLKTWWGIYAEYNKKLSNSHLPQNVRKIYEKQAADAKECAEFWEKVFFEFGYYTVHLSCGGIDIVDVNNLDEVPF